MAEQTGISFFGASPTYQQLLARQGIVPRERFDLSRLESRHARRVAGHAGMHALVPREREARHVGAVRQRRDGRLQRLLRRCGDPAGLCRRDPGAAARRRPGSLRRRWQKRRRRGRGDGHHGADAVDAGVLLERSRRCALPGVLLRGVSRCLAPRRLLPHQRARRLLRARSLGCDPEPPRRAYRDGGDLPWPRRATRGRRCTGGEPRSARRAILHAALRQAARRAKAGREHRAGDKRSAADDVLATPRAGSDHPGDFDPLHAHRQEARGSGAPDTLGGARGARREPRCDGRSGRARFLHRVRAHAARLLRS